MGTSFKKSPKLNVKACKRVRRLIAWVAEHDHEEVVCISGSICSFTGATIQILHLCQR